MRRTAGLKISIHCSGLFCFYFIFINRDLSLYIIMESLIQTTLKLLDSLPIDYRESAFPLLLNHALTMERLIYVRDSKK